MFKFRLLLLGIISTSVVATANANQLKSDEEYKADSDVLCKEQWTKRGELNSRMYQYCMSKKMDGLAELKHLHKTYNSQRFYSDIAYPHCVDKWTQRDIADASMLSYCLTQEVEGYKDYEYYRGKFSALEVDAISKNAIQRFGSWRMVSYKLKESIK